jgi:hypothetical protein
MTPGNQPIDIPGRSLDKCLDVSVGKIPDPAADAKAVCLLGRCLPEIDALYSSPDPDARPYGIVHSYLPIMCKNSSSEMIFTPSRPALASLLPGSVPTTR